jgi:hypothetical protein
MFVTRSELTSARQPPIHSWWPLTMEAKSIVSGFVSICADVYQGYSSCKVLSHFTHFFYLIICAARRPRAHRMSFINCFAPNFTSFTSPVSTSAHLVHHVCYSQPVNSFIPLSPGLSAPPTSWQVQLNYPFRHYSHLLAVMSKYLNPFFSSSNYCFFCSHFSSYCVVPYSALS